MANFNNVVEHEFTYTEFIDLCANSSAPKRSSHASGRWSGTETFEQAIQFADTGWDAGIEQLKINDGTLIGSGCNFNENLHGSVVNVGAYLQGLPNSMWELSEEREYNLEPLTIYIPLSMLANNSVDKANEFCQTNIDYINRMQSSYNVRIIGVFESTYQSIIGVENIIIKDYDERFVINNIAFAFHPSFFRRIQFRFCEIMGRGYGGSHGTQEISQRIKQTNQTGDKCVMIPSLNSLSVGAFTDDQIVKINFEGKLKGENETT